MNTKATPRPAGGWAERLYLKLGHRIVYLIIVMAAWVFSVLALFCWSLALFGYLDGSASQYATGAAILAAGGCLGIAVGLRVVWSAVQPGLSWLRNPDGATSAEDAWRSAVYVPLRLVFTCCSFVVILVGPAITAYVTMEFNFSALEGVGFFGAFLICAGAIFAVVVFTAELLLRPAIAEIAAARRPGARSPTSHWNARTKTTVLAAISCFAAAAGSGALLPDAASPGERLALTTAVAYVFTLLVILPIFLPLTDAILRPIKDLRNATDRVSRGDYSTPIAQTTADEFGEAVAGFNHLQQTVEAQVEELRASRARIVAASDAERRRVERNLHDGAQQQLVALSLQLNLLKESTGENEELAAGIDAAGMQLSSALAELRELARGLHPQVLSTGGLKPALEQLAQRSPIPVTVDAPAERYADQVESTAYFVVSEALANVAKYAEASRAEVSAERSNGCLTVTIADDGIGGADPNAGSGLSGLADRVAALNGVLTVDSPAGGEPRSGPS